MSLTQQALETFKRKIASLELIPDKGGLFEVQVDGELIFSKLATDRFPEWEEIEPILRRKVGG